MIINSNIKGKNLSFLKQEFEKTSTSQILLGKAVKKDIHKYGVAKIEKNILTSIVEKPSILKAPLRSICCWKIYFK